MATLKGCLDAGKVVLFLPPRVTIADEAVTFRIIQMSLVDNEFKDIIADFSNCVYLDSSGVGELISCFYYCQKHGGSFNLNRVSQQPKDALIVTKLLTIFNVYEVDYSNYIQIDISSDDLSALKAASSAGIDTLNLILTLSNGRIQILPGQQDGIFKLALSDNPNSELIIAAPYVIANVTRSYIRDEIEEFEELINSSRSTEHDIQKFLENHPKFLLGHEYQKLHPQVILEREEQGKLIPDFLVQPFNKEFCDIVDLKLPSAPLIVGKDNRKRFSSSIAEAAAQLRTYRDYFDDGRRREAVKRRYGITAYRPRLAVILGRAVEMDAVLYKQIQGDLLNIEVITYDDLIQRAKNFLLL
ncbi:MAG TPA: Shedu anti-phage system protein SduA domain-containing protein [Pyrinomonadaceae bacterium]|nr:Shedu anti-phage system protein SduA domain-containing protein [Pyrinomonadaceae bacterium]